LKKRADFLRAAAGRKFHTNALTVQVTPQPTSGADGFTGNDVRVGLTVTKKVGGAVERNRIRRRLREALRTAPRLAMRPGHDYVIVARRDALVMPFAALIAELDRAVRRVHAKAVKAGRHAAGLRAQAPGRDAAEVHSNTPPQTER
jgi:ribonuclease P protein component